MTSAFVAAVAGFDETGSESLSYLGCSPVRGLRGDRIPHRRARGNAPHHRPRITKWRLEIWLARSRAAATLRAH